MNKSESELSILFAGDFSAGRGYEQPVIELGANIFGDLKPHIARSDLSFLNLESPLCSVGNTIAKTGPSLSASADSVKAIVDAGFGLVGLANNHIMDLGDIGLEQTIKVCKDAGLTICGAGNDLTEAQQFPVIERRGVNIAVIAVAEHEFSIAGERSAGAAPLDIIDNIIQIERARRSADIVIVTIHGGSEYFPLPRPGLRKLCRFYISRGADAVICHHTHVPGAYEFHEGKPIVYSLGNLIFDHPSPPENWDRGYAVNLLYSTETKSLSTFSILPYSQSVAQNGVKILSDEQKEDFMLDLDRYKKVLQDSESYFSEWRKFCLSKKNLLLLQQYSPLMFRGMGRVSGSIDLEKLFMPNKVSKNTKLNLIRCESHLEMLQTILSA